MIKKILSLFKKQCNHTENVKHTKYFAEDGTPMIKTVCDCGYVDEGHVYADPLDWIVDEIVIKNGVRVNYDKGTS